jgi:hypothetical protein
MGSGNYASAGYRQAAYQRQITYYPTTGGASDARLTVIQEAPWDPAWRAPDSIVHMVFTSRRGMAPATRAFVEHVAKQLPPRFEAVC